MADPSLEQPYPRPLSGKSVDNPPPALVPARSDIIGNHVLLEPQDPARHASALYQCSHENEDALKIWDYLTYGPWTSAEAYRDFLKSQSASLDPIFYSLRDKQSDTICGQASYLDISPVNGVIEIGHIWFGPSLQRTTAATEALYLMIKYAMEDLGYRRMQWRCNSLNQGSRNAAKRLGFRFEGIFYSHIMFKGKNRDTAWYSILDDEWPEINKIIERWLDKANFDVEGNERLSLSELMQHRSPITRGD